MIKLTEPQVWVLIGVFAVSTFGMITIITVSFTRTLNAAIGAVRTEISGLRDAMNAGFETMNARFDLLERCI